MVRDVGGEDADLAIGDLARRAGVLPANPTGRLALLEKAGLIKHQNSARIGQCLQSIITHDIAQCVRIPLPRIACCRHGPASPAASARIQPVLRRSSPSSLSRNCTAETATRSWVNSRRIRPFTSRSEDAQSSSVVSIDAPVIHDLRIMETHGFRSRKKRNCNARASRLARDAQMTAAPMKKMRVTVRRVK